MSLQPSDDTFFAVRNPITLKWDNLNYAVQTSNKTYKQILHNISGQANPYELVL